MNISPSLPCFRFGITSLNIFTRAYENSMGLNWMLEVNLSLLTFTKRHAHPSVNLPERKIWHLSREGLTKLHVWVVDKFSEILQFGQHCGNGAIGLSGGRVFRTASLLSKVRCISCFPSRTRQSKTRYRNIISPFSSWSSTSSPSMSVLMWNFWNVGSFWTGKCRSGT